MHAARQTQRSRQRWAVPAFGSGSTTAQSLKCLMLTIEGRSFRIAALTSLPRSTVIRVFPHRQVLVIKVNYMVIEYQDYYIIELKLTVAHDWWWSELPCRSAYVSSAKQGFTGFPFRLQQKRLAYSAVLLDTPIEGKSSDGASKLLHGNRQT